MRIGTTGSIQEDLHIGDLCIALGACTNSSYAAQYQLPGTFAPIASFPLVRKAEEIARQKGYKVAVGNVASNDTFYDDISPVEAWRKMGVLALEMESLALYCNAARCGKNAMTLLTVSDELLTHKATTPEERQTSFTAMMEVALETAVSL